MKSSDRLTPGLDWLPTPPDDFQSRCRELIGQNDDWGTSLRCLATFALAENQLVQLARAIAKLRSANRPLTPLKPFRLAILSNATVDFLVPALTASACRHGLEVECVPAPFGQVLQEALSPHSLTNHAKPDAVLLALDYRAFPFSLLAESVREAERAVEAAIAEIKEICRGLHANSGAICILQTLAPPPETLFGSLDATTPGTLRHQVFTFNTRLQELVKDSNHLLLDVCGLAACAGLAAWHSPGEWNLAKIPFASAYLPLYAEHVCRLISASRGKSRRCLVLDLDNTVWGGVIGDDGLEGIQIAQGDATGEAFLALQRTALALRQRGVILAVSSKNEDATARQPFQRHPEMLLREEHIAVFQANWNDKATNLRAIAKELALGIDALVLLDDNPAERALVRQLLPEVAVPELPADPALYARTLLEAGYFEAIRFSREDAERAEYYAGNAKRAKLEDRAGDLNAYLNSLDMEVTFQPFDETGRARICQLINKSNQFNLTTRRYTEAEIGLIQADPRAFTLQVRLRDVFGENGMISAVICREKTSGVWEIDTWLMSCRVLGRRVEEMVLQEIIYHARRRAIAELIGFYVPTDRNSLVKAHYEKLGFEQTTAENDGSTVWRLRTEGLSLPELPARFKRAGFAADEVAVAAGC